MTCSRDGLKDYLLGDLPEAQCREVEIHARTCGECREELERLRLTQTSLLALRDEEIPQRIAFVSDKVYEPSAVRRWLLLLWNSAPRLGFASAGMVAAALFFHALYRPQPTVVPQVDVAAIRAEFAREMDIAVRKAVAETEARQTGETARLLAAAERRHQQARQVELVRMAERMDEALAIINRRVNVMYRASADWSTPR